MRLFAQRAFERKQPLPISFSLQIDWLRVYAPTSRI